MIINKKILSLILPAVIVLLLFGNLFSVEAKTSSTVISNEVSSLANTGGNSSSGGSVTTSEATTESQITTEANGEVQVKNEVKAEAKGQTARVRVNDEEKTCQAEYGESCQVDITSEGTASKTQVNSADTQPAPENQPERNLFEKLANALSDFTGSLISHFKQFIG